MKPTACIGCRLRRRRCDRNLPICNSCIELNIPAELCIYRDLHSNKKTSSGKDVFNEVSADKIRLTREKLKWKRLIESKLHEQSTSVRYRYQMEGPKSRPHTTEDDVMAKLNSSNSSNNNPNSLSWNRIEMETKRPKNGVVGSLSWGSLMSVEPNMKSMLSKIDEVIINEKEHIKTARDIIEAPAKGNHLVTQVKERLILSALYGETFEYDLLIDNLLKDVESNLPSEKIIRQLLSHQAKFSPLEFIGWMGIDEFYTIEKLNSVLSFKKDGRPKIHISSFEDPTKIADLAYILSFLIFPAYHRGQLNSNESNVNQFVLAEYAEVFTFICNRISPVDENSLHIFPQLTLERLQTWMFTSFFFKYTPSGRPNDNPLDTTMNLRYVINLSRIMGLNTDIDITFSHLSPRYRKSLKSFWILMTYADNMEVLETGLPPKIKPSEVFRYDDLSNFMSETIVVLNRVLYNYSTMDVDTFKDPDTFISIVENEFISDIETLLKTEYGPLTEEVNILKTIDLNDPKCCKDLMDYSARFTQRFHIYTLMQTLYYFCYKKLEPIDKYSTRRAKYGILSMKYSSLIIYLLKESFAIFDKHIMHPKNFDRGVLECAMGSYPHVNVSVRTVFACAGGRLFQGLPIDETSAMHNFVMGKNINEKQLLKEISLKDEFRVLSTLEDLQDLEIDHDEPRLLQKFSLLENDKYIIFSFSKIMSDITDGFFEEKSHMNIGRLNIVFFYLLKITSFFLNSTFTSDGKPIENEHFYMGFQDPKRKVGNSDFTFGQLFDETLNTSSTNFDFQNFFNLSNNRFESNEIDQFLLSYPTNSNFKSQ